MCIVADPPTFVPMFKESDPEHSKFVAVRDWVKNGTGKFVIGGSTYKKQLEAVSTVMRLVMELKKVGKLVSAPDVAVDAEEALLKRMEPSKKFDDPHLVALVRLTGCRVVCLRDTRAHPYLKAAALYPNKKARPKLYTRATHQRLLCPSHVVACCK